jgi:Fe-S-cluster containining protein
MSAKSSVLTVISSCDGCGACCQVVTRPPFVRVFNEAGEGAWERLRWERPELLAQILTDERDRSARGEPSFGTPCLWFDPGSGGCQHYDYRPRACREFEVGGRDCRDARRRAGVDPAPSRRPPS